MSARIIKRNSAAAVVAPFFIPRIGGETLPAEIGASLDLTEAVDFEPFVEVERIETPATFDHILQEAEKQAGEIIAQAEEKYELIEQAARDKAMLEAQAAVEVEVAEKIKETRENLSATIRELDVLRDEISVRVEQDVVELALEIAKKIVGREVMFDREIALTLVKVSLKKINSRAPLAQIHLNPEDYRYIESRREQIDFRGSLELIEDRSISPGGCLIHTETGEVDARIESQFEEIAHGLLGK